MIRGQAVKLFSHLPQENRLLASHPDSDYNRRQLMSSILESKMYQ